MNLPYYIARHLYKDGGRSQNVSRPSVRIATLGIAVCGAWLQAYGERQDSRL